MVRISHGRGGGNGKEGKKQSQFLEKTWCFFLRAHSGGNLVREEKRGPRRSSKKEGKGQIKEAPTSRLP